MFSRYANASIISYFRAAPFPHLTTCGMAWLALLTGTEALWLLKHNSDIFGMLVSLLALSFIWGMVLCQADALSRFREYQRLHSILIRYGFRHRILKPVATSRCQRDAAMHAARKTGFAKQTEAYFSQLGYRWYHILPDQVVRNPLTFFSPHFLRTTFLPGKGSSSCSSPVHPVET